jgi:hypothetical protein
VDEHWHNELQKGDFQVSKGGDSHVSKGEKGVKGDGGIGNGHYPWM